MTSVTLARHVKLEDLPVEQFTTTDGQGKPSYAASVTIKARVLRQDKLAVAADGSRVRTNLTVWVPPNATVLPDERARVTWETSTFIVVMVKDVKGRDAQLLHRRIRCRRE